jgi:hypothetical protein
METIMKIYCRFLLAALLAVSACSSERPADPGPVLTTNATIKDIMDSMVDPSADYLFESVATIADENGITEKAPQTDEEWREVRRRVVTLLEAPNLLVMAGRKVAQPGEKSENPGIELQPEEIQKLMDGNRGLFIMHARALQDAAMTGLDAIDRKDKEALFAAGEEVDEACEGCHLEYWYPSAKNAVQ